MCARRHACGVVDVWAASKYATKIKAHIFSQKDFTDKQKTELYTIGKHSIQRAGKFGKGTISQEMVDLYWSWVWDFEFSGSPPNLKENFPILMSEMTCWFEPSKKTNHFRWWIKVSCLKNGKPIRVPLTSNPYITSAAQVAKGVLANKRNGRWCFQFCEKVEDPEPDGSAGKIGIDVGLHTLAATSTGRIYGTHIKEKFDKRYIKVRDLRANRQRQGLPRDSKRLAKLESKLTGFIKTETNTIANKLVKTFPKYTFVVEDLDLSGCKGQKRFAYRAVQTSLSRKAVVLNVNPAHTSQTCPSCGHVSRANRKGTTFECRVCGKKGHADFIGGFNLLRRSEDKQIKLLTPVKEAKSLLRERYLRKRNSSLVMRETNESRAADRELTVRVPRGFCIASNALQNE
jgi:putative transposase